MPAPPKQGLRLRQCRNQEGWLLVALLFFATVFWMCRDTGGSSAEASFKLMSLAPNGGKPLANSSMEPLGNSSMLHTLRQCKRFECLRRAHAEPRPPGAGPFNFPHFLILGWQKTATTSLFRHFANHPQVIASSTKEPMLFTNYCKSQAKCPRYMQEQYIKKILKRDTAVQANLTKATFEASTLYAQAGAQLAHGLHSEMPWLRLVASMREPISRHMSMLGHNWDRGRLGDNCTGGAVYECLFEKAQIGTKNYSYPLSHWLAAWPVQQLHIIQYERLTAQEGGIQEGELRRLHSFLGLDSKVALGRHNVRKTWLNTQGWAMTRYKYQHLVDIVRPDAELVARMLADAGLIPDGAAWLALWEAVWQRNLDMCDADGNCMIRLS